MSKLRALARYWFIAPLLLLVLGLQLGGIGFIASDTVESKDTAAAFVPAAANSPAHLSTSMPTLTPIPLVSATFTPRPTFTPSPPPTSTATITPTPSNTPSPSATPTATPTPTPQPTPLGDGFSLKVPILMYHYLSVPPADADAIRLDLSVTPDQFEAHLAYLRQVGYETISMKTLAYFLSQGTALPPQPIIITFDDGYRDNYENAFPILRKYGYTGTFFIFTQPIDDNNVNYLSWNMVIEMHRAGMEFGSHSYRHLDLRGRDVDLLVYEILGSKEAIEERTKEPVRFFSYPSGYYDELTVRVLDSAHFWGALTTQYGADQSFAQRFEMSRIRVRGSDTVEDLAEKLDSF